MAADRPTRVTVYNKAALASLLADSPEDHDRLGKSSIFSARSQRSGRPPLLHSGSRRSQQFQTSTSSFKPPAAAVMRRSSVRSTSSLADALLNSVIAYDPNDSPQRARLRARHVQKMKDQMREVQAAVDESRKRAALRREARAARREAALERGRDDEKVIVGKVTTHLEERWQRKKEIYDSWVQNVFEPVNTAVAEAVNKRTASEIQRDRCQEYQRYLDATNTRDLFTDIVSGDYDPYRLHKNRPKPRVPRLLDPLKRQIHSKMEEDALIISDTAAAAEKEQEQATSAATRAGGNHSASRRSLASTGRHVGGGGGMTRSASAAPRVGGVLQGGVRSGGGLRGSQSAAVLRSGGGGGGGGASTRALARSRRQTSTATTTGRGGGGSSPSRAKTAPRTPGGGLRPRLAQGPGFGVHRKNLLGRSGGKWTLPVSSWGAGKLEANSAACTVKTRMAGGVFDTGPSLQEWCASSQRTFDLGKAKVLPDQFTSPTNIQQYNAWNRELPRPQKRTFAPWHHGNILQSNVPGQTHTDTDADIKRIG